MNMSNKNSLYIIIALLVAVNIATLSYVFGVNSSMGYRSFGMMGGNNMMNYEHWKEHTEIDTWENMVRHMEEEHGEVSVMHKEINYNNPVAETHNKSHDFGRITKKSGVVNTTFEIENHGKKTLEIGEISTSCGCTTAQIDKTTLEYNEEAKLTVFFDPNFHDEPQGKITRSVFVKTNDAVLPELQFDIFVEILD